MTELRARELFEDDRMRLFKRVDKLFLVLLYFQWALATIIALILSPQTWDGPHAYIHFHVVEAFLFGGALVSLPTLAVICNSGQALTRHVLAIAEMLMCGLLIQFTDGRIESHFSIFGALAFLAFYRDWKVLITASLVVAFDHLFRGIYWPQSVYGEITATPWRTLEHTAWVLFEDLFLIPGCLQSTQEMHSIAYRQSQIEAQNLIIQRDNEAKMRALVDGAVDGIVTLDQEGTIESMNTAFARMFGCPDQALVGKNASAFLDKAIELKHLIESSKKNNTTPLEIAMKSRVGQLIPVEISISEVHLNDRTFYTAIIRDISERKEVELRVSEFYSVVSHELRTPLTSIRGALGLIEGGIVGEVSTQVLELITIARSCSDRLIRLINDILDLRKIEAGKIELRLGAITLSDIIEKTVSGINGYSAEKKVEVITNSKFDADMYVDSDRIIQVLTNLLSNAIKFSEAGNTVELKTAKIDNEKVRFSVIDHGIGLNENDQARLFQKFQQLDASDTRKSEGTGLGLAISKALVEFHGGEIGVNSKLGEGSEFWFELPLESVKSAAPRGDAQFGSTLKLPIARREDDGDKTGGGNAGGSGETIVSAGNEENKAKSKSRSNGDGSRKSGTSFDGDANPSSSGNSSIPSNEDSRQSAAPANGGSHKSETLAEQVTSGKRGDLSAKRERDKPIVLIIEDDDATRKIVGTQLKTIDLECLEADNGAIGIELAQACSPDLIVLDLDLPQYDGFELVSMLRAEKGGETPLLVYTGQDLTQNERAMLSLGGATKHLIKSTCSMNEFLDTVKELLLLEDPARQLGANAPGY